MAEEKPRQPFIEYGVTGLNRYGGAIDEEFLPQLKGRRAVKVYREMSENDPVIGAILFAITMLVRRATWTVVPASRTDARDLEAADFLRSCMEDMEHTWQDFISEVLSFLVYGYALFEPVYKRRLGASSDPKKSSRFNDGAYGWRKIPIRSQDTIEEWKFDSDGTVTAAIQSAPPAFKITTLPLGRLLHFKTSSHKGNPEGRSVLRTAYRPWFFGKRIETIEAVGVERDLAGLPVAFVPPEVLNPSAGSDEAAVLSAMKELVVNIRRDEQEGIVFPLAFNEEGKQVYDLKLLSSGGARQFDTDAIIGRYNQLKAMTVLADFIMLGHEKVGSQALGVSKTELFKASLEAFLDSIEAVLNRQAVPRLFALNSRPLAALPRFEATGISSVDLTELGNYIKNLAGAGMDLFPDEELSAVLRQKGGLPEAMK